MPLPVLPLYLNIIYNLSVVLSIKEPPTKKYSQMLPKFVNAAAVIGHYHRNALALYCQFFAARS